VLLASRSAAKLNGGNPYLSFNASLTLTGDILSRALMAPGTAQDLAAHGLRSPYTVALAPNTTTTTGSVLLITVTGSNRTAIEHTLNGVTSELSVKLAQLQSRIRRYDRIRAATLSVTPRPTLSVTATARPLVGVVTLGLLVAFGIPVLVDGQITQRRSRKSARPVSVADAAYRSESGHRPVAEPRTGDWPPVRNGSNPRSARTAGGPAD
jgi:hypothetical protein